MLAMRRAIEKRGVDVDCALIDGNHARGFHIDAFPIVKGDAKSASIAAASILAKVTRDRMCLAHITADAFPIGSVIDAKGVVDVFNGVYQLKVFSAADIVIH